MMAYYAGTLLTKCQKKDTTYQVVSCSSSKFTFHVVYYQRQGMANNWMDFSVCFECWLDKPRVEIVIWAALGVACQQQFNYNSVSKFWQCERNLCEFNSRIKCEKAFSH